MPRLPLSVAPRRHRGTTRTVRWRSTGRLRVLISEPRCRLRQSLDARPAIGLSARSCSTSIVMSICHGAATGLDVGANVGSSSARPCDRRLVPAVLRIRSIEPIKNCSPVLRRNAGRSVSWRSSRSGLRQPTSGASCISCPHSGQGPFSPENTAHGAVGGRPVAVDVDLTAAASQLARTRHASTSVRHAHQVDVEGFARCAPDSATWSDEFAHGRGFRGADGGRRSKRERAGRRSMG